MAFITLLGVVLGMSGNDRDGDEDSETATDTKSSYVDVRVLFLTEFSCLRVFVYTHASIYVRAQGAHVR